MAAVSWATLSVEYPATLHTATPCSRHQAVSILSYPVAAMQMSFSLPFPARFCGPRRSLFTRATSASRSRSGISSGAVAG